MVHPGSDASDRVGLTLNAPIFLFRRDESRLYGSLDIRATSRGRESGAMNRVSTACGPSGSRIINKKDRLFRHVPGLKTGIQFQVEIPRSLWLYLHGRNLIIDILMPTREAYSHRQAVAQPVRLADAVLVKYPPNRTVCETVFRTAITMVIHRFSCAAIPIMCLEPSDGVKSVKGPFDLAGDQTPKDV